MIPPSALVNQKSAAPDGVGFQFGKIRSLLRRSASGNRRSPYSSSGSVAPGAPIVVVICLGDKPTGKADDASAQMA